MPVRQHVAYLDGIRALAALFVILHHSASQMRFLEDVHRSKLLSETMGLLSFGHDAVDVFIVLSGFCLALPVVRGDNHIAGGAVRFFQKRARRILPPYFLAFAFSLLLIRLAIGHKTGTLWDVSLPVDRMGVITHLFLVQDFFNATSLKINYALWSISVEWRIYFLFPLLMALRRQWGAFTVAVVATLVSYLAISLGEHSRIHSILNLDVTGISPQYLGLFAVGLLGADIAYGKNSQDSLLRRPLYALALLGMTTLLLIAASEVKLWHGEVMPVADADFFVGLWAASLMIAAANTEIVWLNQALSWRPLVFIGTFAYSLYLIHGPMIQVIWQFVLFPLRNHPVFMFLGLCFLGLPLIVGTAYLFFLVCERPFLNTRRQEKFAETERDAALSPAP